MATCNVLDLWCYNSSADETDSWLNFFTVLVVPLDFFEILKWNVYGQHDKIKDLLPSPI